jgi:hypothetical protein
MSHYRYASPVRTFRRCREWCSRQWDAHTSELACSFGPLALIFGLITAIQAVELDRRHLEADWGSVPNWFGAIGAFATVAALAVAWLVFRHEVRIRREDQEARDEAMARQQTDLITAWVHERGDHSVVIGISNASRGVVYDLSAVLVEGWHQDPGTRHREAYAPVVAPGSWKLRVPHTSATPIRAVEPPFRDSRGVRWLRDESGVLHPETATTTPSALRTSRRRHRIQQSGPLERLD